MKTKTVTHKVYISNDGKEFDNEKECKSHEEFLERSQIRREIDARLAEIEVLDTPPFYPLDFYIHNDSDVGECRRKVKKSKHIRYFLVQDETDLEKIAFMMLGYRDVHINNKRTTVGSIVKGAKVKTFPDMVCIGTDISGTHIYSRETEKEKVKKYLLKTGITI